LLRKHNRADEGALAAECSTAAASRSKPISDRTNRPSPWDRSLGSSMSEAAPVPLSMSICSSAADHR
jgi:hypothetical protein